MISAIRKRLEEKEEGFTLIELLVVVIIIGILAAIAIPVFLNQRERAWRSAVQSDLRNAAVSIETYYTDNGNYNATTADLEGLGFVQSDDVTVVVVPGAVANAQDYCLEGTHANLDGGAGGFIYESDAGGMSDYLPAAAC